MSRSRLGAGGLHGTWRVLAFALRRDRVRLLVWLAVIALVWVAFTAELAVMQDEGQLAERALVLRGPAMIMMTGPGYGLDDYTVGAALAEEVTLWFAGALAVLSILEVVRHTRAEEESGRAELIRAAPVGRHAAAAGALPLVTGAQAAIAAVGAAVVVSVGDVAIPDALALTGGLALVGVLFAAVALAACQLVEHGRTATGLSLAVFGAAFALRAIGDAQQSPATGDAQTSWLSWLSRIAWVQQTRAFVDLRVWPLWLIVAATAVALACAMALAARRDFGAGVLPARAGRASARAWLAGPLALAARSQGAGLAWTTLGLGLLWLGSGTVIGSLDDIRQLLEENPLYAAVLGEGDLQNAFFALLVLLAAVGAAAWGVASVGRLRAEETAGRTEVVLATPVARWRWIGAQLVVSAAGTALLLLSGAVLLWAGARLAASADAPAWQDVLALGAAHLPGALAIVVLAAALYAWLPRVGWLAWLPVAWAIVVGMFADLFDLPDAARAVSPFWWAPNPLTGDDPAGGDVGAAAAVTAVCGVVAVVLALALWGFRRRGVPA